MKVFNTVKELRDELEPLRQTGKIIGLVPTMGALHEGHLSLVRRAKQECDIVVVSDFVNPIQFNNQHDLETYPRTLDEDVAKLQSVDCDYVLAPSVEEMYPTPVTDKYSFGIIEEVMEGPRRPGHFSGVAVVVRRLFDIVEPRKAYFGEKDFQQIAIIKNLVKQINYDIEIVPCPIVRADDGLALSSRNKRLSPENRAKAPKIHATLSEATQKAATMSVAEVKQWVMDVFSEDPAFEPEYFEIVEDVTLQPVSDWNDADGIVGCIAVWMDDVRLIDIIRFK